jgi:hypothetical protein
VDTRSLLAGITGAALLACASANDGPVGSNIVFQIADYRVTATSISCYLGHSAPDSVYFNVHLVNTTDSDVTVTKVGTSGVIVRAEQQATVGHSANSYETLPYNPQPALLVARTGDRTMTVSMPTIRLCSEDAPDAWKDVYITLRVSTTAGQFNTTQIVFSAHTP